MFPAQFPAASNTMYELRSTTVVLGSTVMEVSVLLASDSLRIVSKVRKSGARGSVGASTAKVHAI